MYILSEIVKENLTATDKTNGLAVGEGLAPPEIITDQTTGSAVGEGLAPPEITIKLKPYGYRYSGRGRASPCCGAPLLFDRWRKI